MANLSEAVVKVRAELDNAVVVRPGDKLVYATPRLVSQEQADLIKERFAERVPGVDLVIVDQCSGLAVYRDDEMMTYRDCSHPALKAISDRLEQSDEALSAAWLRKVIAESA